MIESIRDAVQASFVRRDVSLCMGLFFVQSKVEENVLNLKTPGTCIDENELKIFVARRGIP